MAAPQGQGWAQAPDGSWHLVAGPPPKPPTNPWMIVGWVVVALIFIPCVGCAAITGLAAIGSTVSTTTTTTVPVTAPAQPATTRAR